MCPNSNIIETENYINKIENLQYLTKIIKNDFIHKNTQNNIGNASDDVISCPQRTVCSDTSEICGNSVADCSPIPCYECTNDRRFACINATSFAYCFGNSIATSLISSCPSKQFCDPNAISPNFCSRNPDVI